MSSFIYNDDFVYGYINAVFSDSQNIKLVITICILLVKVLSPITFSFKACTDEGSFFLSIHLISV